jgi:hypothetical protein
LVDTLVRRFAVATVASTSANTMIDYAINEGAGPSRTSTAVTIVNNDTSGAPWTGTITFPGSSGSVSEWVSDTAVACSVIGNDVVCNVSVPGGDVRVFVR